jgi:hypothetical protein
VVTISVTDTVAAKAKIMAVHVEVQKQTNCILCAIKAIAIFSRFNVSVVFVLFSGMKFTRGTKPEVSKY